MIVLVSAVSHAVGISGVQRHALNLVRALETCSEIDEVHVAVGPWQAAMQQELARSPGPRLRVHIADSGRGSISRNAWHYSGLPELAARLLVDIVHFTYPVPVNADGLICRSVVTLHDLYPYVIPANFGFPRAYVNRWILWQCLRAVDGIACVSEHTRAELERYMTDAVSEKTVRIYNCVDKPAFGPERCGLEELRDTPFLLCVAQHRRNKNLSFLLRVFDRLRRRRTVDARTKLVLVGISGPETSGLLRHIDRLDLRSNITLLEGLSDEQLQWCFAHCDALLAPSVTEGFGLPVVEGLLIGCRVICSDIAAFREFGYGRSEFVQLGGPAAEDRFAAAVERSLREPKPPVVRFPQLSPETIGREYFAFYESVLNRHWVCTKDNDIKQPTIKPVERRVS